MGQIEDTKCDMLNEETPNKFTITSSVFKRLHWTYLIARVMISNGENLPFSYRYAILQSYGFRRSTIEQLTVVSHASSLILGTVSVPLADRFGRRIACLIAGILHILNFFAYNFSKLSILILGYVLFGLGEVMHANASEAWLFHEHHDRRLDTLSLQRIIRNTHIVIAFVAVCTGFIAQFLVTFGDYTLPFNVAIVIFIALLFFIWEFWTENYGIQQTNAFSSFGIAFHVIRADSRIVLLGLSVALLEVIFAIYATEWTPTIQYTSPDRLPLGLGVIYSLECLTQMIGAYIFEPLSKYFRAQSYMIGVFLLGAIAMTMPVIFPHSFALVLTALLLSRFCAGLGRTSLSMLRNSYYPNEVRATIMIYMGIPQLILVLVVFLGQFELRTLWITTVCFNIISMLCMAALRNMKMPDEVLNSEEEYVLVKNGITTPTFALEGPQPPVNTHE